MPGLVDGQVGVVTGGASGIGRAIAKALAREGASAIVIADVQEAPREGGEPTHEVIECDTRFVECDVSKPADVERAVAAADEFGGVDIMVNNAGVVVPGDILEVTEEDYDRQMDINAKGTFFGTQAAARRMVEKGTGVIVNMSSVAGIAGTGATAPYCASKGAIRLMTYAAAHALAPRGVRVNTLHPGVIATELIKSDFGLPEAAAPEAFPIPVGRAAKPEEVADVVVMVCSEHARYMNGASLVVDGGLINTFG